MVKIWLICKRIILDVHLVRNVIGLGKSSKIVISKTTIAHRRYVLHHKNKIQKEDLTYIICTKW